MTQNIRKNLLLLGAPGAGKGTQAKLLVDEYSLGKIDTGNLIREAIRNQTSLGKEAESYVKSGKLVPDKLVINLIIEEIHKITTQQKNFLLDGFPRNISQAEALEENKLAPDFVISLDVDPNNLVERISGRRICTNKSCGAVYHVKYNSPKEDNKCDLCGSDLYQRDDDKQELVKIRLETYLTETAPLIEYYAKKNKLISVLGEGDIQEIFKRIKEKLKSALVEN